MSGTSSEANTWFAVLHAAVASGDRDLERLARSRLKELGCRVIFSRSQPAARLTGREAGSEQK
jgi:hypothetical protein